MRDVDEIALLEPQIPALRRYAFALLRDREAADDLVQDTLEQALGAWSGRRSDGDLRAWLFTIERNLFLGDLRRRKRRGAHLGADALEHLPDTGSDPEASVIARDVLESLNGLPEEQRSVVLLIAVEDLSYAQAAQVLDVPVGTVMSRLSRARERMRGFLTSGGMSTKVTATRRISQLRRVK